MKTHGETAAAMPLLCESGIMPCLHYAISAVAMVVTCQSQGSHTLKHTLLYGLFYSKWDHNLLKCCIEEDLKLASETIKSLGNSVLR